MKYIFLIFSLGTTDIHATVRGKYIEFVKYLYHFVIRISLKFT